MAQPADSRTFWVMPADLSQQRMLQRQFDVIMSAQSRQWLANRLESSATEQFSGDLKGLGNQTGLTELRGLNGGRGQAVRIYFKSVGKYRVICGVESKQGREADQNIVAKAATIASHFAKESDVEIDGASELARVGRVGNGERAKLMLTSDGPVSEVKELATDDTPKLVASRRLADSPTPELRQLVAMHAGLRSALDSTKRTAFKPQNGLQEKVLVALHRKRFTLHLRTPDERQALARTISGTLHAQHGDVAKVVEAVARKVDPVELRANREQIQRSIDEVTKDIGRRALAELRSVRSALMPEGSTDEPTAPVARLAGEIVIFSARCGLPFKTLLGTAGQFGEARQRQDVRSANLAAGERTLLCASVLKHQRRVGIAEGMELDGALVFDAYGISRTVQAKSPLEIVSHRDAVGRGNDAGLGAPGGPTVRGV